ALPSAVQLALFLAVLLMVGALLHPVCPSLSTGPVAKALAVFLICAFASVGTYFAVQALTGMPGPRRAAIALTMAAPLVLAEVLVSAWLQTIHIGPLLGLQSVLLWLGCTLAAVLTVYLFLQLSETRWTTLPVVSLLILAVAGSAMGFTSPPSAEAPSAHGKGRQHALAHVILITVDTLRADCLSCYDPAGPSTPHMDQLAGDAVLFERAYSSAPWTLPAVASVMTGLPASVHQAVGRESQLPDAMLTLAELMKDAGYYTAAMGSNAVFGPHANLTQGSS
ncbi:unnamed protein product, partial [marine sediment metagenome]